MSRVIVKNLPAKISEDRLRSVFSESGEITDVSLKYKNGVFRKFGFIGFKGENEAHDAIKRFNKTFIGTSKLEVDICHDLNATDKPRPWSRHSAGSSAFRKRKLEAKKHTEKEKAKDVKDKPSKSTKKVEELLGDLKDSTEFEEFLAVHQNRQTKSLWADDVASKTKEGQKLDASLKQALEGESDDSDSDYADMPDDRVKQSPDKHPKPTPYVLKMKGVPKHCKDRKIIKFFEPLKVCSIRVARNNNKEAYGLAYVSFESPEQAREALTRNKRLLGERKVILTVANSESAEWNKKSAKYEQIPAELVADTGRLYIRNLSYSCDVESLEELFQQYGPVTEVHLPVDKSTRKIKGFAFVTFMMPEHALKAYTSLDGHIFQGRILHILPAKEKEEESETSSDTFKKKRDKDKKALATSSHNWNALFLGANAVADAMADKFNKSKSEILEDGSQSLGVRMALGETQLVAETRQFLLDEGVELDLFSQANAPRSKTVILVKNLPSGTDADEIRHIFEKHGQIERVVMPPSGLSALVQCDDPTEAKTAFKKLAYTKFKYTPLYLEWAPMGILKDKPKPVEKPEEVEKELETKEDEEVEVPVENDACLFVKNLNFDTKEDAINDFFKKCGKIKSVTVSRKSDPKNPGNLLSMGYGFVQFLKKKSAQKALKELQHKDLEGHTLELKISTGHKSPHAGAKRKHAEEKKQTSSKIMIRNIPFEAHKKEIEELFKVFGEIKMTRLPKKLSEGGGSHRGFGFVDFVSKEDAKRAFNTLCHSTHLYGRRLVLEWAENEESIDELREKTAKQFLDEAPKKKNRKKTLEDDLKSGKGGE